MITKRLLWFVVSLLLTCASAVAGGRGGHNTTFDANLFGGPSNVSCLTAAVAGVCATGYNAPCDGVSSDSTAYDAFRSASVAANPAPAYLYIPPPCKLKFASSNGFIWDGVAAHAGIQRLTVWAYGVTAVAPVSLQTGGFWQDNVHSARIQTAIPGDATVTLVTASDALRFSVGDWICVDALELQTSGFPPNFAFFEYRLITAITGTTTKVFTLSSPLTKTYKSTWPLIDAGSGSTTDLAGPATIHVMQPSWNANTTIYGLTVPASAGGVNSSGRDIVHYDVVFNGTGNAPTTAIDIWYFGSSLGPQVETDKEVSNLNFVRSSAQQIFVQSSSVDNLLLDTVTLWGALNGTALNTTIRNSVLSPVAFIGPTDFGHGNTLTIDGTTIPVSGGGLTTSPAVIRVDPSIFAYSSGVFSIPVASAASVWQWAVPGQKYFFAKLDNTQCSTPTTFTITDLAVVSTTLNITTDLVGALPTPCSGGAASWYVAYPAATITQKFSGPANLTQYAAP